MALLLVIAAVFSVYMESKPKQEAEPIEDPGPEIETEIIEPEPEPEVELIPDIKENGTKRKNAKT